MLRFELIFNAGEAGPRDGTVGRGRSRARVVAALLPLALVSACVNPSARIASELSRYGLDAQQSQCVGDRLEANLSIGQLQQLARSARAVQQGDTTPGRLTASDLVRVASTVQDPRVPIEVTKAAAGCGVLAGAAAGLR